MNWFSRMHAARTPWLGWWLALALVVAPALGRMHEVLHAPTLSSIAQASAPAEGTHAHAGIAAWFDGHSEQACLVLDQLGHGASNTPATVADSHPQPTQPPLWTSVAHLLPAPTRIFEARAPPEGFMA